MFIRGWQVPSVEVPPPNKRYLKVAMSPEVTGTHNATLLYSIISPGYMDNLFQDPLGSVLITVAVVLQVIGFLTIRKIVNFKV